jgi:glycosyltransferase involved in cell wall biosynthesis
VWAVPSTITTIFGDGSATSDEVDVWVVNNCVTYGPEWIERFGDKPVVKYINDAWPHGDPDLKRWLLDNARLVSCSPAHADWWRNRGVETEVCPPAMNLQAFRDARQDEREGTVWLGAFTNHAKGIELAVEWAHNTRTPVDFYGSGPLAPRESELVRVHPPVAHEDVPALLGRSERLVFLPTGFEPFGRVVAEAWAAGCEVVTNELVGARHYLKHDPVALDRAARTFWDLVCDTAAVKA